MSRVRLTLAGLLAAPVWLAFYLFIILPLLLLMAGLDALAPRLPTALGGPLRRALRAELRVEARVDIVASPRRASRLLFGPASERWQAEHMVEHAAAWGLDPSHVQETQETLQELEAHA